MRAVRPGQVLPAASQRKSASRARSRVRFHEGQPWSSGSVRSSAARRRRTGRQRRPVRRREERPCVQDRDDGLVAELREVARVEPRAPTRAARAKGRSPGPGSVAPRTPAARPRSPPRRRRAPRSRARGGSSASARVTSRTAAIAIATPSQHDRGEDDEPQLRPAVRLLVEPQPEQRGEEDDGGQPEEGEGCAEEHPRSALGQRVECHDEHPREQRDEHQLEEAAPGVLGVGQAGERERVAAAEQVGELEDDEDREQEDDDQQDGAPPRPRRGGAAPLGPARRAGRPGDGRRATSRRRPPPGPCRNRRARGRPGGPPGGDPVRRSGGVRSIARSARCPHGLDPGATAARVAGQRRAKRRAAGRRPARAARPRPRPRGSTTIARWTRSPTSRSGCHASTSSASRAKTASAEANRAPNTSTIGTAMTRPRTTGAACRSLANRPGRSGPRRLRGRRGSRPGKQRRGPRRSPRRQRRPLVEHRGHQAARDAAAGEARHRPRPRAPLRAAGPTPRASRRRGSPRAPRARARRAAATRRTDPSRGSPLEPGDEERAARNAAMTIGALRPSALPTTRTSNRTPPKSATGARSGGWRWAWARLPAAGRARRPGSRRCLGDGARPPVYPSGRRRRHGTIPP